MAKGEPRSNKDRLLMSVRPHLVLDGAVLAARSVRAKTVVLYVGSEHGGARRALEGALRELGDADGVAVRLVFAPPRYIAGEESAAVHCVNEGVALPTAIPPRPFESGVDGLATLVQNVETLAHVALIARFGAQWFRDSGTSGAPGTTLLTLSGAVERPGVVGVPSGTALGEVLDGVAHPAGRDRSLRLLRRLRLTAALLGTAAVGAFTGVAALNNAAATAVKGATTTSTSQTSSTTSTTTTPTAGSSPSTPTTAPTAAPASSAATVSGGS